MIRPVRPRFLAWLVLATMIMMAVVPAAAGAQEDKPYGGAFVWGNVEGIDTLNTYGTVLAIVMTIEQVVYDTLVDYDQDFNFKPRLAREWEFNPDNLTYTFHLQQNARWHDGRPLTARDVKFTIDFVRQYELGTFASYVAPISEVQTPDDYTVVLKLEYPSATFLAGLRNLYIVPEHIWGQFSDQEAILKFENDPMIGSGPFKFVAWKKGEHVKLEANPDYWGGRPYVDEFIIRQFQNEEALVQALLAGEADAIDTVPANLLPQLTSKPEIKVVTADSFWFNEVILNSLEGSKANPLIFDPAVRRAMAHAVDKQFLIKTVLQAQGVPGLSVISPANAKWFNSQLTDYEFDLEKAKAILDAAGYQDRDGDGIREDASGKKLEFRFNTDSDANNFRAAQIMSDWWKKIGISTNPQMTEDLSGLVYADDDKNGVVDHNFDILIWSWSGEPDPDFNLMTMITAQIGNWQDAGYSNPEYDQLYVDQGKAVDPELRRALVWKMQEILLRDVPYIVMWSPKRVQAYRADRWENPVVTVDGMFSRINAASARTVHKVMPKAEPAASAAVGTTSAGTGPAGSGDSAAQASSRSGGSPALWIGLAIAALAVVGIAVARRRSRDEE